MLSNKTFFDHTSTAHKLSGYVSTECFVWNWKYRTCGTESGKLIFTSTPTGKFASLRTSTGTALNNFARHFGEMLSLNQLVSVPQSRRQQATRSQAGTAEISSFPRFSVTSWEFIPRGRLPHPARARLRCLSITRPRRASRNHVRLPHRHSLVENTKAVVSDSSPWRSHGRRRRVKLVI